MYTRSLSSGSRPWYDTGEVKQTYPPGRRCHCGTVLSIYNESDCCQRHQPEPTTADMMAHLFGKSGVQRRISQDRTTKFCSKCGQDLPLTQDYWFFSRRRNRPGLACSAYCKKCMAKEVTRRRKEKAR